MPERLPPPEKGESADYRASRGSERYLIEVKDREPPDENLRELRETQSTFISGDLGPQDAIRADIRKASSQLSASASAEPAESKPFRVIALFASVHHGGMSFAQFRPTFYGSASFKYPGSTEYLVREIECLYFSFNPAFDLPDVDALLIGNPALSFRLCLNEFSHRILDFKTTHLYREFKRTGRLFDPVEEVKDGRALTAFNAPREFRKDEAKMAAWVKDEYRGRFGEKLTLMNWTVATGVATVLDRSSTTARGGGDN